jgi:uncharacterized cupredoxin-like copper-binding protein
MVRLGKRTLLAASALLAVVTVLAACGGDDEEGGGGGATTVDVALGTADNEYELTPDPAEAPAGSITFAMTNAGELEHEFIVIKTDKGAANLGTESGEADETGAIDELELEAGDSGELTLDLEAGPYALICNIEDHYAKGMFADFTVT